MSQYYQAKRVKNLYNPSDKQPFKLSRSKLELFLNCPRCFYMDRRLGVGQPPGFPFNLNSAVDHLLKKEFDVHRAKNTKHPLMEHYGVDAVPFAHANMDQWRENFVGVQALHKDTNLLIFGAVDDLWTNPAGELIVVDYKATSKDSEVNLDAEWQRGYKNQMEIYQWLLRQNGFDVNPTGYFVYCNGKRDAEAFDGKLEFDIKLIPYTGDDSWVDGVIQKAKQCLDGELPTYAPTCDYCAYRQAAGGVEGAAKGTAPNNVLSHTPSAETTVTKVKAKRTSWEAAKAKVAKSAKRPAPPAGSAPLF
ncbi:PD-(D/E)XK nuclease family protein [bacterium]|nr:MAG: PD-(D/E)XK nuclease family protein [bacterium]